MKTIISLLTIFCICLTASAQKKGKIKEEEKTVKEYSEIACSCIDTISLIDKTKKDVSDAIGDCINSGARAYAMLEALMSASEMIKNKTDTGKTVINITPVPSADFYYKIERYLMDHCPSIKEKIASNNVKTKRSYSENQKAIDLYTRGQEESEKENYKAAAKYYRQALDIDSNFAFAWDNLGITYRKLEDYDNALYAYKKSLQIDPKGITPLQNMAIVYQYKNEPEKAVKTYELMLRIDSTNAEVYYGIAVIYAITMKKYEEGLQNVCKAYNIYAEQQSPYRADAEKVISMIYAAMKNEGNEDKFQKILKANNINMK